jgi:hypothetical protein
VYLLSLGIFVFNPKATGTKRLLLAILTQVVIVIASYFYLF